MTKKQKNTNGFTIAEVLICLAIFSIILTAVAVAFEASGSNYNQNRDMFQAVDSARMALGRMTSQIRSAQAVSTADPATQCSLITSDSQDIVFRYNSGDKTVYLDKDGNSYRLCTDVEGLTFTRQTANDANGVSYVKSVKMSITVKPNDIPQTLSTAVVLRKML